MKKKLFIIIPLVIVLILGITFAMWSAFTSSNIDVVFNVDGISVTYSGGPDISGIKLIPVSSKEKGEVDDTGIAKTITASSETSSNMNINVYMDLNLNLEIFPSGLKHESLVWEIYEGNTLINSGNFADANQGDTIKLFKGQEIHSTTSTFKLYIWIDGLQSNPESIDNQSFKFVLSANASNIGSNNLDNTGANAPVLDNAMIPVIYDTTNSRWVKADSTNSYAKYQWYNYDAKMWANAVLVSSTNRSLYQDAQVGTPISEEDILAYYVWIPRYKYKVWNINKVIGTDSYNAKDTGIDIVFENGTASTGTISCNYDFMVTAADNVRNETCTGSNGDYYTHPAFTFGNQELTGIWVGKFEISSDEPIGPSYNNGISTIHTVRVKPNVASWRNNYISNFWKVIYDMQSSNNTYGLPTTRTNTDSHMMKNMEWGAVAYLTNSEYGRCTNNVCTEVAGSSSVKTGAAFTMGGAKTYDTAEGQLASTTGNIYGIYDMSGGEEEYVMGNMSGVAGMYSCNTLNSMFDSIFFNAENEKYVDTYARCSGSNQIMSNSSRLGDATGEVVSSSEYSGGWYSDINEFVLINAPWFIRGGISGSSTDNTYGIFGFDRETGSYSTSISSRAVLLVVSSS